MSADAPALAKAGRRLLLVDDDDKLARLLIDSATDHGFSMLWADRPSAALELLARAPDLILLDIMLPEQDGFAFCRQVREKGVLTPIIMLTARGDEMDRIQGLKLGADDYVAKPFSPLELFARVEAVLRRPPMMRVASDGLDRDKLVIRLAGREIALTPQEFRLLDLLIGSPGRVYTRDELLDCMGDEDEDMERFDRAIDTCVSRLRTKLEPEPRKPRHLITVRGIGYRFEW